MPQIYEKDYKILSSDVDMYRRMKVGRLFTEFQEASIAHTTELGMGREKTLDRGFLWVVVLHRAQVERMPVFDEKVKISSWPGEQMHMFFPRYFRVVDQEGVEMVRASSLWVLLDAKTRKIVQPEVAGVSLPGLRTGFEAPLPRAVKHVEENGFDYRVPFSYADINGHMNNTRYFDLALDLMDEELRKKNLKAVEAEYTCEVRQGKVIQVYTQREEKEKRDVFITSGMDGKKKLFSVRLEMESGEK